MYLNLNHLYFPKFCHVSKFDVFGAKFNQHFASFDEYNKYITNTRDLDCAYIWRNKSWNYSSWIFEYNQSDFGVDILKDESLPNVCLSSTSLKKEKEAVNIAEGNICPLKNMDPNPTDLLRMLHVFESESLEEVEYFKPSGAVEVRKAGDAFLRMRERIERHIRQRTEMLAGVSHDLRTPLTRLKLELAMLKDTPAAVAMQTDVDEMDGMIEGYLAFAEDAAGEQAVDTDVNVLLNEAAGDARRQGVQVEYRSNGELRGRIRPLSLKRCLDNLLGNAHRYAKHCALAAWRDGDSIVITVEDDGPGISEAEREAAFRPFFRLENSRNQGTGGVGLGLAITRDTVRNQGGDVLLDDAPLGGLRAMIRLPA